MVTTRRTETGIEAQLVLADGTVAGTGCAQTADNAVYFACRDAMNSGDARLQPIARFEARNRWGYEL